MDINIIKNQIMNIRDSGETNMFDINTVQRLAFDYDYYELVYFIDETPKKYIHFILTGNLEAE